MLNTWIDGWEILGYVHHFLFLMGEMQRSDDTVPLQQTNPTFTVKLSTLDRWIIQKAFYTNIKVSNNLKIIDFPYRHWLKSDYVMKYI